jgi:hypothetical protein
MTMTADYSHHKTELEAQGFTRIPGFYTREQLAPLKHRITDIIARLHALYLGSPLPAGDFDSDAVQCAYMAMVAHDRKLGGVVYDAVKQIPEFVRITASGKNLALACALRGSNFMGIARGGDGIRIDYPNESTYMAPWHQDYLSQLGSIDGLVFWSPLVDITMENGPVELCVGSHKDGPRPIYYTDASLAGTAYGMRLLDEEKIVATYPRRFGECLTGDLWVFDYLLLHRSSANRTPLPRWTMQLRYFNFNHAASAAMGWPNGFSQGNKLTVFHPELIVPKP